MQPDLAPGFLVAFPHLRDPNFRQSVVLLLEHRADEGATGVVVNRESPLLLCELCRDQELSYGGDGTKRVRQGGPLQPEQGLVLYDPGIVVPGPLLEGQSVVEGLSLSTSRSTLGRLCELERGPFECFSGYAGWGPGQLEREIGEGTWIVAPARADLVLQARPELVWERTLRDMGIDPAALVPGSDAEA